MTTSASELKHELNQYTGGDQVYHHALAKSFFYTAGMRAFFQKAGNGAYWLSDILATEPLIKKAVEAYDFCLVLLTVRPNGTALLTVSRDATTDEHDENLRHPIGVEFRREINCTDCPEGQWYFYLSWTRVGSREGMIAMLPREY